MVKDRDRQASIPQRRDPSQGAREGAGHASESIVGGSIGAEQVDIGAPEP